MGNVHDNRYYQVMLYVYTADTSGLAAFRGSILLWVLPVLQVFQGSVLLVMQVLAVFRSLVLLVLRVLAVLKKSQYAQCTRSTTLPSTICAPFRQLLPFVLTEHIHRWSDDYIGVGANYFRWGRLKCERVFISCGSISVYCEFSQYFRVQYSGCS